MRYKGKGAAHEPPCGHGGFAVPLVDVVMWHGGGLQSGGVACAVRMCVWENSHGYMGV